MSFRAQRSEVKNLNPIDSGFRRNDVEGRGSFASFKNLSHHGSNPPPSLPTLVKPIAGSRCVGCITRFTR